MLLGKQPVEIHVELFSGLSDKAPSIQTFRKWITAFQQGLINVDIEERSRRPLTARSEVNVDLVRGMIVEDRRLTCEKLSEMSVLPSASSFRSGRLTDKLKKKNAATRSSTSIQHLDTPVFQDAFER